MYTNLIEHFENMYLTGFHHSSFTRMLVAKLNPNSLLNTCNFISAYIRYPPIPWSQHADVFEGLENTYIERIINKKCFLIIDASEEGYCPIASGWFDAFYHTINKYQIDPKQILFVSSNLKDEQNIDRYTKVHSLTPIHVVSWLKFEGHAELEIQDNTNSAYEHFYNATSNDFSDKLFSSLSRTHRPHKSYMQYLLYTHARPHAILSHDKVEFRMDSSEWKTTPKSLDEWYNALPLIADYTDFSVNWACRTPFSHLHTQTLFHVVNETWGDMWGNNSIFYSEKTFMPVSCFTPFVINGPVGINHYLEKIGYKLYTDWFDLSFDFEKTTLLNAR